MEKVEKSSSLCKQLNNAIGTIAEKSYIVINAKIIVKESSGKLSHYQ